MKKYPNDLIGDIMKAFGKYADRPAFVIEDTACTYGELATCVQKISSLFKDREDKIIGIVAENRLETYASILSALICGKDRKSTRLNSSHSAKSRMPSSA